QAGGKAAAGAGGGVVVKEFVIPCTMTEPQAKVYSAVASSPEVVAALSGEAVPSAAGTAAAAATANGPSSTAPAAGGGGNGPAPAKGSGLNKKASPLEEAFLALRRAALTGALEKTPPPGRSTSGGQAEAHKEEFWRGHAKDLELSVPERLEKYSGKLAQLGRAVRRLTAAGKKVLILGALPDGLALVHQYLAETDVPHECWAANDEMFPTNTAGEKAKDVASPDATAAPATATAAAAGTPNGTASGVAASAGGEGSGTGAAPASSPAMASLLSAHHRPHGGSFPPRSSSLQVPTTPPKPAHERLWNGVQGPLWRFRSSSRTPVLLAPPSAVLEAVAGGSGLCRSGARNSSKKVRRGSLMGLGPIDAVLIFDEDPDDGGASAAATAAAAAAEETSTTASSRIALTSALQSLLTLPLCSRRGNARPAAATPKNVAAAPVASATAGA
ncbi:unnamed protein product, partial [Scytosiphon promiscuus]